MKAVGWRTRGAERALRGMLTEIPTMACSSRAKRMGKGCTLGRMDRCTTESGITASSKATGFGKETETTAISENGLRVEPMAMEFIPGQMVIGMKASGSLA